MIASDLEPLGHLNLLSWWDLIHGDELEIPPEVLIPVAHDQSEQVAEFFPQIRRVCDVSHRDLSQVSCSSAVRIVERSADPYLPVTVLGLWPNSRPITISLMSFDLRQVAAQSLVALGLAQIALPVQTLTPSPSGLVVRPREDQPFASFVEVLLLRIGRSLVWMGMVLRLKAFFSGRVSWLLKWISSSCMSMSSTSSHPPLKREHLTNEGDAKAGGEVGSFSQFLSASSRSTTPLTLAFDLMRLVRSLKGFDCTHHSSAATPNNPLSSRSRFFTVDA